MHSQEYHLRHSELSIASIKSATVCLSSCINRNELKVFNRELISGSEQKSGKDMA